MQSDLLTIGGGGVELGVCPRFGGTLAFGRIDGVDFLRPVDDPRTLEGAPLQSACFPLVPFSNRIRGGRFAFDGRDYALPANWDGDDHVIHGRGWTSPWAVEEQSARSCVLRHDSDSWWPWRYRARQHIAVANGRVEVAIDVENRDGSPMPAGLGLHPYFPKRAGTRLAFAAESVIGPMTEGAPLVPGPIDDALSFRSARRVGEIDIDHCFGGWDGRALITDDDSGLTVSVEAAPTPCCCVLFAPRGEPTFCLEPVSHLNGALNMRDSVDAGVQILEPGERFALRMTITPTLSEPATRAETQGDYAVS